MITASCEHCEEGAPVACIVGAYGWELGLSQTQGFASLWLLIWLASVVAIGGFSPLVHKDKWGDAGHLAMAIFQQEAERLSLLIPGGIGKHQDASHVAMDRSGRPSGVLVRRQSPAEPFLNRGIWRDGVDESVGRLRFVRIDMEVTEIERLFCSIEYMHSDVSRFKDSDAVFSSRRASAGGLNGKYGSDDARDGSEQLPERQSSQGAGQLGDRFLRVYLPLSVVVFFLCLCGIWFWCLNRYVYRLLGFALIAAGIALELWIEASILRGGQW